MKNCLINRVQAILCKLRLRRESRFSVDNKILRLRKVQIKRVQIESKRKQAILSRCSSHQLKIKLWLSKDPKQQILRRPLKLYHRSFSYIQFRTKFKSKPIYSKNQKVKCATVYNAKRLGSELVSLLLTLTENLFLQIKSYQKL